jgi:hypothetical protein
MKKIILGFAIASTTFSVNAFASATGCGMGSMVFTRNSVVSQSFAASTNITGIGYSLSTGSTGVSSNCKVDSFIMKDQEKIYYVESNYRHLEEEMAQGKGENLAAFAQLFGCGSDLTPTFGEMTRENYRSIFRSKNASPSDVLDSVEAQVRAHPVLSKSCFFLS